MHADNVKANEKKLQDKRARWTWPQGPGRSEQKPFAQTSSPAVHPRGLVLGVMGARPCQLDRSSWRDRRNALGGP